MDRASRGLSWAGVLLVVGGGAGCAFDPYGFWGASNGNGNGNTPPGCGDGEIQPPEECDDGNTADGDGCSAACQPEEGWQFADEPSVCLPWCGDGLVRGNEACDDGDTDGGDGCSPLCEVEPGWSCNGEPSVCVVGCGDGFVHPSEACDDGNTADGDGCSATCQPEEGWHCETTGEISVCLPVCGDGLIVGDEQCDDGNLADGDGCAATCDLEPGWSCGGEPSFCAAWANTRWGFRKRITIHHEQVAEDLQEFPVLIHLASDPDIAAAAQQEGEDLLFTRGDGTTRAAHEIQRYLEATGELIAWVKVDALSGSKDTSIYLYYGEPLALNQQQAAAVWSNGYEAVLHLQEEGGGTTDEFIDSTGNGHHGTGGGVPGGGNAGRTPSRAAGWHGHALQFDGDDDHLRLRSVDDGVWGAITVQIWMSPADLEDDMIFAKAWGTAEYDEIWSLGKEGAVRVQIRTDAGWDTFAGGNPWVVGAWHHYGFTWDAGDGHALRCYQNGELTVDDTRSGNDLHNSAHLPSIGNVGSSALSRGFAGRLQEARLSRVARGEGWLWTETRNVDDPGSFYTVHPEEAVP